MTSTFVEIAIAVGGLVLNAYVTSQVVSAVMDAKFTAIREQMTNDRESFRRELQHIADQADRANARLDKLPGRAC